VQDESAEASKQGRGVGLMWAERCPDSIRCWCSHFSWGAVVTVAEASWRLSAQKRETNA
jgi:hypothetical protein